MPVAKERDFESGCQAKRCRADASITVFTVGLCDLHWIEASEYEGLLKDWCASGLNQLAAIEVRKAVAESESEGLLSPTIPELFLSDLPRDPKVPPVREPEATLPDLWPAPHGERHTPVRNERLEEMRQRER